MSATDVFTVLGSTVNIPATATAASTTFSYPVAISSPNIRVYNAGPNTVFVRWGVGTQIANATADVPISPGMVEGFFKGQADTFSAICAASQTATVYFTPGIGL